MKLRLKRIAAHILIIILALGLMGCSLVSVNEEKDMAQIAAKAGDIEITKGEVVAIYEQFVPYASMYGFDTNSNEGRAELVGLLLDDLINEGLLKYQARQKGFYSFGEEERKELDESVLEEYNYFMDSAKSMAEAELAEDPDLDINTLTEKYIKQVTLNNIGLEMTGDELNVYLKEYFEDSHAIQAMMDDFNAGISVSDEEVRSAYDTKLAEEKTTLEQTPGDYKGMQESADLIEDGVPTLYTPAGYRRIRLITIAPEDELTADYETKKQEINDLTLELGELSRAEDQTINEERMTQIRQQLDTLDLETNKLMTDFMASSKKAADEAHAKLVSGSDFVQIMTEYTTDTEFEDEVYKEKGRLVSEHESSSDWPAPVKAAALALTTKGAYSDVIEHIDAQTGVFAYYIAQYVDDEPAGERSFDAVKISMEEETLSNKQNDEWNALVSEWMLDTNLVTRYENIISTIGA